MAGRGNTPETVVLVGGVFDLLHYGHIRFLKKAKSFGDTLVVAVNRDEFVQRYKNKKPVMTTDERIEALSAVACIDEVVINEKDEDWLPVIQQVRPSYIVTSTEWEQKGYYKQMGVSKEIIDSMNIELVYLPYTQGISTTEIIRRIKDG